MSREVMHQNVGRADAHDLLVVGVVREQFAPHLQVLLLHVERRFVDYAAGFGGRVARGSAAEEPHARAALERSESSRNSRMAHAEMSRGLGERLAFRYGEKQ